ncbi:hypothetical protein AeRB84_002492 [Aphanomyces euteiches]|nr:hypothetical protein AeRB84_002492 [Aphanomyces euteiches]
MECLATMEDITEETYVEYQTYPSMEWHPSQFCADVVLQLLDSQFSTFMKKVQGEDDLCFLAMTGTTKGPPVWIEDKYGFPLPENGDTHIVALWFSSTKEERSAKLTGAVEGEEREKLWSELKELLNAIEDDKEEMRD